MTRTFLISASVLAMGAGVALAETPAPRQGGSEPATMFLQLDAPVLASPVPSQSPRMPPWQSGFSNPEQLRNEMLSHQGWGGG